jgi:hypothetical protein
VWFSAGLGTPHATPSTVGLGAYEVYVPQHIIEPVKVKLNNDGATKVEHE